MVEHSPPSTLTRFREHHRKQRMGQGEWHEIISSDYDMAVAGVNSWHLGFSAGDLHKI